MKRVPNQTGTILLKGVPVTNDQAGFAHLWRQLAATRVRFEAIFKRKKSFSQDIAQKCLGLTGYR